MLGDRGLDRYISSVLLALLATLAMPAWWRAAGAGQAAAIARTRYGARIMHKKGGLTRRAMQVQCDNHKPQQRDMPAGLANLAHQDLHLGTPHPIRRLVPRVRGELQRKQVPVS